MSEKTSQPPTSLGQTLGKADFTQRPMSLRKFLEPFDHSSLTDVEAGEKYAAYKASFAKQQLEDFFEKHKNLAWFREKYHPDIRPDPGINLKLCERRLEIFMDLYKQGALDSVALHIGNEGTIVKFLDTIAVRLAGGTDEDVKFLEEFKYVDTTAKVTTDVSVIHRNNSNQSVSRDIITGQTSPPEVAKKENKGAKRKSSRSKPPSDRPSRPKQKKSRVHKRSTRDRNEPKTEAQGDRGVHSGSSDRSRSESATGSSSDGQSSSSSSEDESSSSSRSNSRSASSGSSDSSSSSASGSSSRSSSSASSHSADEVRVADPLNSNTVTVDTKRRSRHKRRPTRTNDRCSSARSTSAGSSVDAKLTGSYSPRSADRTTTLGATEQTSRSNDAVYNLANESQPLESVITHQCKQPSAGSSTVYRRPVHHTSVLYFPHIPFNVYQKDLIALLSTSPHFIRLAVLDPCVMPASDKLDSPSEPFFNPDTDSSFLAIALRRVGWASFAAQVLDETGALIDIDLDAIRMRLIDQASEAQAPDELLDCLRLSRPLPDPMRRLPTDRVRSTSFLLANMLKHCPSRLYSKSVLRRHLVLAARLIDELDRARGLWSSDVPGIKISEAESKPIDTTQSTELVDSYNEASLLEDAQTPDDHDGADDLADDDREDKQINKPDGENGDSNVTATKDVESVGATDNDIDPGEDLVIAATMLSTVVSKNPLLIGLTDYLVDEGNAEEELLLSGGFQAMSFIPGMAAPVVPASTIIPSADNTEMLQALDRLILYLRVVHSVDFYAPALYVNEDAMPHPCQLLHVRPSKAQMSKSLARFIPHGTEEPVDTSRQERLFANQLRRLIRLVRPISASDCMKLGFRDVEEVVEAFVKANTRRKKRKTDVIWVCPLSDKKFRDPIYVKKHIMNKHMEKVEAVKKDTAFFFNNYLLDPMRPQLPIEPRVRNQKRQSRSRDGSRLRKHIPASDSNFSDRNHDVIGPSRERSNTDQSAPHWLAERQMREEINTRAFHLPGAFGRDHGLLGAMGPPRSYNRMPYFQSRLPFHAQRGRYFGSGSNYQGIRQGFQRRPYVDLDAP